MVLGVCFEYNCDLLEGIFVIICYDCEIGEESCYISGMGGVVVFMFLFDGKYIVFVCCVKDRIVFFIKDIKIGVEILLMLELE